MMPNQGYKQRVIEIMTDPNRNPYASYHQINFENYGPWGEETPINKDIINDMPKAKIILTREVYEWLLAIQEETLSSNQEFPFLLYGYEREKNQIEFSEFMSSSSERQSSVAVFDSNMQQDLQNKINANKNRNFVVCHGHSHTMIGDFCENFSLGDFMTYMEMNESNGVFKNKEVELTGCVVTPSGDINFIFYDNQVQNFYRFTYVYVRESNNTLTPVKCYGQNQGQTQYRR